MSYVMTISYVDVRYCMTDVRHRVYISYTTSYVKLNVRHRTCDVRVVRHVDIVPALTYDIVLPTYDIVSTYRIRHRTSSKTYDIVRAVRTISYVHIVYDIVRTFLDVRCRMLTYDIVCAMLYRMCHEHRMLTYDIVCDIVYDIVHSSFSSLPCSGTQATALQGLGSPAP